MGGGGGSGFNWNPEKMKAEVRRAENKVDVATFETSLAEFLGGLLPVINGRDNELIKERIEQTKLEIGNEVEGAVNMMYGGSVAKHTHVDGFSDVDTLLILNNINIPTKNPHEILDFLVNTLQGKLPDATNVTRGHIALTITYNDGMEIQILPALKTQEGLKVPAWKRANGWSDIDPTAFNNELTKRNQECGGKLIPTIKLIKAINSTLPDQQQLSGYHIESLAISAFRQYEGTLTPAKMVTTFFEKATDMVRMPIKDTSGQSIHVDGYLGAENSLERQQASHILNRISKRIRNANAAQSQEQWQQLFDI